MSIWRNVKKKFFSSTPSAPSAPSVQFTFTPKKEYLNHKGALVPAELVNDKLKAKQAICDDIVPRAQRLANELLELKNYIQITLRNYKQWEAKKFNSKVGPAGNVSVGSYDGKFRVQVRSHPTTIYTPQAIDIAKELMGQVIDENITGVAAKLRQLLTDAFSPDSQLSLVSITELMQVQIDDERWQNAVKALNEGREVTDRAYYVDVAVKDKDNKWKSIPLNISDADEEINVVSL